MHHAFQRRHHRSAVLAEGKLQAVPQQVHDAALRPGVRKQGQDRLGKALQAANDHEQLVPHRNGKDLGQLLASPGLNGVGEA